MHILEKGKVTIKEATIDFFKGIFNYLGVTTRRGFGWGLSIGFLWLIPLILILDVFIEASKCVTFAAIGMDIIMLIYFMMYLAAYFRRMRDIGFKARTTLAIMVIQIIFLFVPIIDMLALLSMFAMPWIAIFVPSGQFKTNSSNKFLQFMMVKKEAIQ